MCKNNDLMWSSGQSSWLQIQRSEFDSRHYQIFSEVVDLERGPLGLARKTEKILRKKSSGSGLENRDYGRKGSSTLTTRHPSIRKKLALTSPTNSVRSIGIVLSHTKATELLLLLLLLLL
jgi:hypothetical protein